MPVFNNAAPVAADTAVRYYAEKVSPETRTSSTLADDDDLQVPVPAGTYRIAGLINCENSSTAFMSCAIVCAGATGDITFWNKQGHTTKNLGEGNNLKDNSSGTQGPIQIGGTIVLDAASTVIVQWGTIQSSTTTLKAGSYIELFPMEVL